MTWKKYHLKQEDDLKNVDGHKNNDNLKNEDTQEYEDDITYSNQLSEMEKIGWDGSSACRHFVVNHAILRPFESNSLFF